MKSQEGGEKVIFQRTQVVVRFLRSHLYNFPVCTVGKQDLRPQGQLAALWLPASECGTRVNRTAWSELRGIHAPGLCSGAGVCWTRCFLHARTLICRCGFSVYKASLCGCAQLRPCVSCDPVTQVPGAGRLAAIRVGQFCSSHPLNFYGDVLINTNKTSAWFCFYSHGVSVGDKKKK